MITDGRLNSGSKARESMPQKQKGNVLKGQGDGIGSPGIGTCDLQDTAHLMYMDEACDGSDMQQDARTAGPPRKLASPGVPWTV